MSKRKLVEVKGLKCYFGSSSKQVVKAVDDISFEIFEGETFGLVGESGSGKSTTGRSILRLNDATDGQILFDGKTVKNIKEIIEDPKLYFKKGHLLEVSLSSDITIHKLNRLRFLARELEIQAIDYFVEDYKVNRKDLLEAFNVLSDAIYILILKFDNGDYR